MSKKFQFPQAYYVRPPFGILPAQRYDDSPLDRLPDDALGGLQRAFLEGEVHQQVSVMPLPLEISPDLEVAICQTLSQHGSLKKSRDQVSAQPQPGTATNSPPTAVSPVQGTPLTLSGWMKEYPGSTEHDKSIQAAIQGGPEQLERGRVGVWISDHVDFGLKHAPSRKSHYYFRERFFRTLTIVNHGSEPLILLDICGIPKLNNVFFLHDDYGLAHHYGPRNEPSEKPKGVILNKCSQYQITVELQCDPDDCNLHQQWLMFTFSPASKKAVEGSTFVVGRRVTALVVKSVQDVKTCLSTEAKPFYPLSLRTIFDKEPAHFSCADESSPRKFMDIICRYNSALQVGHLSIWRESFSKLKVILKANKTQTKGYRSPPLSSRCSCYEKQLIQLVRLLALEEAAMELDIKEHDLLNIQMEYHDFKESLFRIEVPGLPENRPCVFVGDVVYVRWASTPTRECAAIVVAVETQPKPQIVIRLSAAFLVPVIPDSMYLCDNIERARRLQLQRVHVRFVIDRLIIKNMHSALERTASSKAKILPCVCTDVKIENCPVLAKFGGVVYTEGSRRPTRELVLINKYLNEEQQMAVRAVLNHDRGSGPYIIFGPPGTGKTVTVVECVLQVLKTVDSPLVCVCAPSNYAADLLCSGISKGGITPEYMWRLNDPRRTVESVKADVLQFCTMEDEVFTPVHPNPSALKVVVCTCAAAAMLHEDFTKSYFGVFTHILIDEAGQALSPETLIPLSLANQDTCCILCGDPRQLGPVVHSKLAATNGLATSLLEQFMHSSEYRLEGTPGPASTRIVKLLRNYRANGKLLELPSRLFYENELIASAEERLVTPPENWEEMSDFTFPMLFYGVKGQQMREGESPSYFNAVETTKVADLITGLLEKTNVTMGDIGVMAPYRRQVQKLRLVLRSRKLGAIRVGTVDDYQGQEEKIIFISTVLTRPESLRRAQAAGAPEQNVGLICNAKRFNVAITRAKAMLVVVGHPVILSRDDNWQELLRYCLSRGAFRGYGSDRIPLSLPSDPFLDTNEEAGHVDDAQEKQELDEAIEHIAEMSLLGVGDVERLYPTSLDSYYAANGDDQVWRVFL